MNKKKFVGDAVLSLFSMALPIFALQFIILPLLSHRINDENSYGLIITLVGIITLFSQTFGSALNNARLLLNGRYESEKQCGDFNPLVIACLIPCVFLTILGVLFYTRKSDLIQILLICITAVLSMLQSYYSVGFRLVLNFKKTLWNTIFQLIGNFLGFAVFLLTKHWEYIYLLGYLLAFLHAFYGSPLRKEPLVITPIFKVASHQTLILSIISFMAGALNYIDRFLLYPMLGGAAVSVYYVSTLFGKAIAMGIAPISGVMLSYFAKMEVMKKKTILQLLLMATLTGVAGYVICVLISPFVLSFLYPDLAQQALKYINVSTLTAIVNMLCTILSPIILKFHNVNWQIAIYTTNIITYLIVALVLSSHFGLMGFCCAALVATVIKLVLMLTICFRKNESTC